MDSHSIAYTVKLYCMKLMYTVILSDSLAWAKLRRPEPNIMHLNIVTKHAANSVLIAHLMRYS